MVGHRGQAAQDVFEVGVRVNGPASAAFDEGVKDGPAFTGSGLAYVKPVLLTEGGGA